MGGNPLAMKVGQAVLNTIIEDGLLDNVKTLGTYFIDELKNIGSKYSNVIKDVRGQGFIIGIEFANKNYAGDMVKQLYSSGVLTIITEQKNIRILPPLIAGKREIDFALKVLESSLREVRDA